MTICKVGWEAKQKTHPRRGPYQSTPVLMTINSTTVSNSPRVEFRGIFIYMLLNWDMGSLQMVIYRCLLLSIPFVPWDHFIDILDSFSKSREILRWEWFPYGKLPAPIPTFKNHQKSPPPTTNKDSRFAWGGWEWDLLVLRFPLPSLRKGPILKTPRKASENKSVLPFPKSPEGLCWSWPEYVRRLAWSLNSPQPPTLDLIDPRKALKDI